MTTPPPEPKSDSKNPPAPPDDKSHGDKPPTMSDVRSMVVEVIDERLKPILDKLSGGPAEPATSAGGPAVTPDSLAKMVDDAVAKVNAGTKKAAADDAHDQAHAKIEAAIAERQPVDRPRRSRWLGAIYDR